jgi:hypothetical protein
MKYLLLVLGLFAVQCHLPQKIEPYRTRSLHHFYYSAADAKFQKIGICVVDDGTKVFQYTWRWPVNWYEDSRRQKSRDELYLGTGYILEAYPDSVRKKYLSHLSLFKLAK